MIKLDYTNDRRVVEKVTNYLYKRVEGIIYVKKLKYDYKYYCTTCRQYHHVSKEVYYQIRKSHICPFCYSDEMQIHTKDLMQTDWIVDRIGNSAYYARYFWKFGKKEPVVNAIEVVRYHDEDESVDYRHIGKSMYNLYFSEYNNTWKHRTCSRAPKWLWWICELDVAQEEQPKMKKDYITAAVQEFFDYRGDVIPFVKSNQKKLMQDNIFNRLQIFYLLAFDLKTEKEVYKYNSYYISSVTTRHQWAETHRDYYYVLFCLHTLCQFNKRNHTIKQLNIYYLDYLYRNKISLRNYCDYADQCKKLNIKLDKPQDFDRKHATLSAILTAKENKENDNKIKKRFAKLKENAYENKKLNISIMPFKNVEEIIYCQKRMGNCIASNYLVPYANGQTDLYHLDVNGQMEVAIEIANNVLQQAYKRENKLPDPEHNKIIKNWVRKLNKERRMINA